MRAWIFTAPAAPVGVVIEDAQMGVREFNRRIGLKTGKKRCQEKMLVRVISAVRLQWWHLSESFQLR